MTEQEQQRRPHHETALKQAGKMDQTDPVPDAKRFRHVPEERPLLQDQEGGDLDLTDLPSEEELQDQIEQTSQAYEGRAYPYAGAIALMICFALGLLFILLFDELMGML